MGAGGLTICSKDMTCDPGRCTNVKRPGVDGVSEYDPGQKHSGMKECIEHDLPQAAAIGNKLGFFGHDEEHGKKDGHGHTGMNSAIHNAEAAVAAATNAAGATVAVASAVVGTIAGGLEFEGQENVLEEKAKDATPKHHATEKGCIFGESAQATTWGVSGMAAKAQAEVHELADWIHESHFTLRFLCLCLALTLLATSALGVFNIFYAVFHPFQYLFACYNVVFAGVIVVIDGRRFQASQGIDIHQSSIQHGAETAINKLHEAGVAARQEFMRFHAYVHRNPVTLKIICTLIGVALFAISFMSMINIFGILINPYQWLIASYNVIFSFVIILVDGPRDWIDKCWMLRTKLFRAVPCLGWLVGRAFFLLYVGSLNLVMLPESPLWKNVYIALGATLCFAGLLMLFHRYILRSKKFDNVLGSVVDS